MEFSMDLVPFFSVQKHRQAFNADALEQGAAIRLVTITPEGFLYLERDEGSEGVTDESQ